MDLSNVKLVVTDMDGTLLNSKHEVSPLFFELFEKLKHHKIQFVAASGRQYHSILDKLKAIEKDITIVAENGAYVVRNGETLFINAFSKETIAQLLIEILKIPGANPVLCGKKRAYFLKGNKKFEGTVSEYYCEYELLDNFNDLPNDDFLKIAICHHEGSEANLYPQLKHLESQWQLKVSGELWLDIALNENHKGNAIARFQKEFNISPEQTMAFGDYLNDTEMLKLAQYSFAMENAHPKVKETANYQTLSNDNLGVESVLSKLIAEVKN